MLKKILIDNYILIEQSVIEFGTGLNIITGETGAGKSILLNALNSTFGQRGFTGQIKPGKDFVRVQSVFDISKNQSAKELLKQMNYSHNGELTLTREITKDETTIRCYINDTKCSSSDLKKISETLLEIHGQHSNQYLFEAKYHLTLLDKYSENDSLLNTYQTLYRQYQQKNNQLTFILESLEKVQEQKEFLLFTQRELQEHLIEKEKYDNMESQLKELEKKQLLFQNISNLMEHLSSVNHNMNESEKQLLKLIEQHEEYSDLESKFYEMKELINSFQSHIKHFGDAPVDDNEIDSYHEKLSKIEQLKRKYNKSYDALLEYKSEIDTKIALIDEPIDREELEKEVTRLKNQLTTMASELHEKRMSFAHQLTTQINESLKELAMENSELFFNIQENINNTSEYQLNETGYSNVEFLYRPSPTHPFKKLANIASGGEISRISLAIKSILSSLLPSHAIIFDEIDTGVGGKTALSIGKKLLNFSKNRQVIVITHLAQIAKYSEHHFNVYKEKKDGDVISSIVKLTEQDKVKELSRMLFGENLDSKNLEAAKDFIQNP